MSAVWCRGGEGLGPSESTHGGAEDRWRSDGGRPQASERRTLHPAAPLLLQRDVREDEDAGQTGSLKEPDMKGPLQASDAL